MLDDVYYLTVAGLNFKLFNNKIVTTNNLTLIGHGIARFYVFNFYVCPISTDIKKHFVLHSSVTHLISIVPINKFKHVIKSMISDLYM